MFQINNLCVKYGDKIALNGINLNIEDNQIISILGPSGSGKTSILNSIAGIIEYEGEINEASISYIFQENRLINTMSVLDNLLIVNDDLNRAIHLLELLEIKDLKDRYPNSLSGGEAKRVNIARAFMVDSNLLLLDEPFTNLDIALKERLLEHILNLLNESPKTVIFVTHDILEALSISNKIYILNEGKIIKEYLLDDKKIRDIKDNVDLYQDILNILKK